MMWLAEFFEDGTGRRTVLIQAEERGGLFLFGGTGEWVPLTKCQINVTIPRFERDVHGRIGRAFLGAVGAGWELGFGIENEKGIENWDWGVLSARQLGGRMVGCTGAVP
jgi:hypothetical protein